MLNVGLINRVKVFRVVTFGYYVGENDEDAILLPNKEAFFRELRVDDELNAFVYRDSEDRLIATLKTPKALLGELVYLKVTSRVKYGYFLDFGLDKDILLPKTKVTGEPKDGYLVRIELDEQSDRLVANAKIREYINPDTSSLKVKDRVKAVIYKSTNLGYSCIINGQFDGLLYRDESFSLKVGDEKTLFIKNIREDGKLDLIIDKDEKLDEQKEIVLKKLRAKMGYLPFTYKSDSDEISRYFGISKKAFKRVLTELIEDKKIELKDDGIYKYRQDAKEN